MDLTETDFGDSLRRIAATGGRAMEGNPPASRAPSGVAPDTRSFYLGVDIGKKVDHSATAILRVVHGSPTVYELVYLERWKLGTRLFTVADRVVELSRRPEVAGNVIIIDQSGVGEGFHEELDRRKVEHVGIIITGGAGEPKTVGAREIHVPRVRLIANLLTLIESVPQRIRCAAGLKLWTAFRQEITSIQEKKKSSGGGVSYDQVSGEHDDLVLCVALALWFAEHGSRGLNCWF